MTATQLIALSSAVFAFAVVTSSCSSPKQAAAPAAPAAQQLWGEMKPVVSVKELMRDMIDPASDYVFDAIGGVDNKKGSLETVPKTEADWDKVRIGGVMLAEGAYLPQGAAPLRAARRREQQHRSRPGRIVTGQIKAKLEHDPVLWNAKIEALRNVGLQVLDIVKRKDAKELWDAADNLDQACEACHLEFWYPGEKAFLQKLDKRLDDLYGLKALHPDRTRTFGMEPPK